MAIALALHILAATIWVGGSFFQYFCLRPAAATLGTPQRFALWHATLGDFLPYIWASLACLFGSGAWMMSEQRYGTLVYVMAGAGVLMLINTVIAYVNSFRPLRALVALERWQESARHVGALRIALIINLCLGLFALVAGAASHGRYW